MPRPEASNDNAKTAEDVVERKVLTVGLLTKGIEKDVQGADSCNLQRDKGGRR